MQNVNAMPLKLYLPFLLILLSFATDFVQGRRERHFPWAMLRLLVTLPLLAAYNFYFFRHPDSIVLFRLLYVELLSVAVLLHLVWKMPLQESPGRSLLQKMMPHLFLWPLVAWSALIFWPVLPPFILQGKMLIPIQSIALLCGCISISIKVERFWQTLSLRQRWQFKYFVLGMLLTCAVFAWLTSYRLTYRRIVPVHHELAALLFLLAWGLMLYSIVRHRLLKRTLFISRQVIYSAVAPVVFILYLLGLGISSMAMRMFGVSLPDILYWLLACIGLLAVTSLFLSGKARHTAKFFLSTNFFVNKYEYRDEWLAFSEKLQGKTTTSGVIAALSEILAKALYTKTIRIWLLSEKGETKQVFPVLEHERRQACLPAVARGFLEKEDIFHTVQNGHSSSYQEMAHACQPFMQRHDLVLLAAMRAGSHLSGIIGLGQEFTGGTYGSDDFDLLKALGSQATSALLAVQSAEIAARLREQTAWQTLSTFVLHDVKNAQAMLSLARNNFQRHIHKPEFQDDLKDTLDDALQRMAKVQRRLGSLQGEFQPALVEMDLGLTLTKIFTKIDRKLSGLHIDMPPKQHLLVESDSLLVEAIFENLLLNSLEAGASQCQVSIGCDMDAGQVTVVLTDNGPGIDAMLLPDHLFEPFISNKVNGSGIGLWQVKELCKLIRVDIMVHNNLPQPGAIFTLQFPLCS